MASRKADVSRSVQVNIRFAEAEVEAIDAYAERHTMPFAPVNRAAALRALVLLGLERDRERAARKSARS